MFRMGTKFRTYFLVLLIGSKVEGLEGEEPLNFAIELQRGLREPMLTKMVRHIVELVRKGLIDAQVENLAVPDVDWIIESGHLTGVLSTTNIKVSGLTAFHVKNLSSSLAQLKMDIDLEAPLVGVTGDFDLKAKFIYFPISWSGPFSLNFSSVGVGGGGSLKAGSFGTTANYIEVSSASIVLGTITIKFDGPFDDVNIIKFILTGISILIVYTVMVLVVELFFKMVTTKFHERGVKTFSGMGN